MPDDENEPEMRWTPEEIMANPEGWFQATLPYNRRRNPGMTDDQLRADWIFACTQMGAFDPDEAEKWSRTLK